MPLMAFNLIAQAIAFRQYVSKNLKKIIEERRLEQLNKLTTLKKRKLKWFGHVSRLPGLAKTILQGTVQGGRRKGRQKKLWENNISGGQV